MKPWTPAEIEYLRQHWGKTPTREIAETLGRSASGIKQHAAEIGLDAGRHHTLAEIEAVPELPPEARELLDRLAAAGTAQHGDHLEALEVMTAARLALKELIRVTASSALPGRYKHRQIVYLDANKLARSITILQRELDPS